MGRISFARGLAHLAPALAACGGAEELEAPGALSVAAQPPGSRFVGVTLVELVPSRPASVLYTLDGGDPSGPGGLAYEGPIQLDDSTYLSFVARGEDDVWSPLVSELYVAAPAKMEPRRWARLLEIDQTNVFFAAGQGDEHLSRPLVLRAAGSEPVEIRSLSIGVNPQGAGFYEEGVFRVEGPPTPFWIWPNRPQAVTLHYRVTSTLRTAMVVVGSDEQRSGGTTLVEVGGRRLVW